ncbi:MAG: hypothetical protein HY079_09275 [Elusimicrobia bacterium]|nr:hypothetical protein [Elusimicrobiota bacterium]
MPAREAVLAAFALALTAAASALAEPGDGSAGLDLTAGSNAYRAARARAWFDLRGGFSLAPRAAFYRSDEAGGTYKLFGLRGGYAPGRWSFGVDAAVQPRVDGYAKSSFGADAAYDFPLRGDDAKYALSAGGGFTLTRHSDRLAGEGGAPAAAGRGRGAERAAEFVVRESDLFAFTELRTRALALSGSAAKSSYDRDLAAADARRVLSAVGDGFGAAVLGFPDTRVAFRLRIDALGAVAPFVSWARTTFELGDPPATAVEVGASVTRGRTSLNASLERYRQAGFPDRRYLTLGGTLDF